MFSVFIKYIDQQDTISGKTLIFRTAITILLYIFYNLILTHFDIVSPTFISFIFVSIFISTFYSLIYKRFQAFNNSRLNYIYKISFYIICVFLAIEYIEFFDLNLDELNCDGRKGKAGTVCRLMMSFNFLENYISKTLAISLYNIAVSFSLLSYFLLALTNSPIQNHKG